jgi:hypothetical protein
VLSPHARSAIAGLLFQNRFGCQAGAPTYEEAAWHIQAVRKALHLQRLVASPGLEDSPERHSAVRHVNLG